MDNRYLYRAKMKNKNEWALGSLVHVPHQDKYYILRHTENEMFEALEECEVAPSTICQCTGLKDKNGKLIWENDIVNVSTNKGNTLCEVRYADSVAQFQLWQSKTLHKTSTVLNLGNYREEVCGNRFDNPELLEVGE